jgi:phosphoglycerol transferase MdoB-like AlkP superfamily enzyme
MIKSRRRKSGAPLKMFATPGRNGAEMFTKLFTQPKSRFYLLLQFALINVVVFFGLRLALFIRAWPDIDHSLLDIFYIFSVGLGYDLAFLSYFLVPFALVLFLLPNRIYHSKAFAVFSHIVQFSLYYGLYFIIVAEWLFWDEFSVRFNFISVDYLVYRQEVTDNIVESYQLGLLLSGIFLAALLTYLATFKSLARVLRVSDSIKQRSAITLGIIALPFLSGYTFDQSLHKLTHNNYENELAGNGPYQFFAAFRNNELDYQEFYVHGDDEKLSRTLHHLVADDHSTFEYNDLYDIARNVQVTGEEKKLNVILISIESMSADFLGRFGNHRGITPFMDRWLNEGMLFTNFYATGTRTTRGLEAITLAVPPTPGRSLVKRPDNAHIYNLGKVFAEHDYDVAFFYGGHGFFDNMNAFFSANGYRTVDRTDIPDEMVSFENAWGVADEDLYHRALQEAGKDYNAGQPFFFHIMTTSNHRPYTYPEGRIDIPSGSGRNGAVKYTDYALGQLIEEAKQKPWFDNTVFVVVADHCASSAGKVALPVEKYHIPLFIYAPKYFPAREIDKVASQIDIAPTLLSLLNFHYESFFFGKNILSPDFEERALIGNYQKLGLYKNDELVVLEPKKQIELLEHPLAEKQLEPVDMGSELLTEALAYYQGADYVFKHRLNRW